MLVFVRQPPLFLFKDSMGARLYVLFTFSFFFKKINKLGDAIESV